MILNKYDVDPPFRQLFEDCCAVMADRLSNEMKMPVGTHSMEPHLWPHFLWYYQKQEIKKRFEQLKREWHDETCFSSNANEISTHSAIQEITAMGKDVLPLIFDSMRHAYGFWFQALREITGDDPLVEEEAGHFPSMTKRWLDWADAHGFPAKDYEKQRLRLTGTEGDDLLFGITNDYEHNWLKINENNLPVEIVKAAKEGKIVTAKVKYIAPEDYHCKDWMVSNV